MDVYWEKRCKSGNCTSKNSKVCWQLVEKGKWFNLPFLFECNLIQNFKSGNCSKDFQGLLVVGGEGARLSAVLWWNLKWIHRIVVFSNDKKNSYPKGHFTHILFLQLNFINKRSPSTGLCSLPDLPHEMVHPTVDMFGGVAIIIHPHKYCHYHDCLWFEMLLLSYSST